jgi:hypothetical protein
MLGIKTTKLSRFLLIALIGWSAVGSGIAPVVAQPLANQHALTSEAAQSQLRRSIAAMTSLDLERIEVRTSNTVVLVRLMNTPYNTRAASDRESLASTIAALLERDRRQDPELARVMELHVQFLKRGGWFTRSIDTVEFRREQSGAFVRHRI